MSAAVPTPVAAALRAIPQSAPAIALALHRSRKSEILHAIARTEERLNAVAAELRALDEASNNDTLAETVLAGGDVSEIHKATAALEDERTLLRRAMTGLNGQLDDVGRKIIDAQNDLRNEVAAALKPVQHVWVERANAAIETLSGIYAGSWWLDKLGFLPLVNDLGPALQATRIPHAIKPITAVLDDDAAALCAAIAEAMPGEFQAPLNRQVQI